MDNTSTPKRGQPTKYKQEYCEQVRKHMAKGYSFESFASDIEVDKVTLYNWCVSYPEFKDAKNIGTEASRKKIEGNLLRICRTGKGNVIAAIYLLKNKFPNEWRDKRELDIQKEEVRENLTIDEQIAKVECMREQLLQIKSGQEFKIVEA